MSIRKIIVEFLSPDGCVVRKNEDISWVFKTFNEEMGKYPGDLMASMDTVLPGRVTYEIIANLSAERSRLTLEELTRTTVTV